MKNCLFDESNNAFENMTNTFSCFNAMIVSLKRTRKEICHWLILNSSVSNKDIDTLLDFDGEIHGVDYYKAFINKSWDDQKNEIVWLLLNTIVSTFEDWAFSIVYNHFPILNADGSINENATRNRVDNLQKPDQFSNEIHQMTSSLSAFTSTYVYPKMSTLKRRKFVKLSNFLYCFQVFKKMRNSYMHRGKKVSQDLIDAVNNYNSNVTSASDLEVRYLPIFGPFSIGDVIIPDYKKVAFLNEIIIKVVVSIDAELSKTSAAEDVLVNRFKNSTDYKYKRVFPAQVARQKKLLQNFFLNTFGVPIPDNVLDTKQFFLEKGLISL